jgi:hypothetical protein
MKLIRQLATGLEEPPVSWVHASPARQEKLYYFIIFLQEKRPLHLEGPARNSCFGGTYNGTNRGDCGDFGSRGLITRMNRTRCRYSWALPLTLVLEKSLEAHFCNIQSCKVRHHPPCFPSML